MTNVIGTDRQVVVVGLGRSGLACVRYLRSSGTSVTVMDSSQRPALADALNEQYPEVPVFYGRLDRGALCAADEIVISPGVPLKLPEIQAAISAGVSVVGDIDLFLRAYKGRVIAITGSNGKSTVTSLVTDMAREQGLKSAMAGNIGIPVLDLDSGELDLVVLELSSFQLETLHELKNHTATVLNVSPDHMDRYDNLEHYLHTKHRIFHSAANIIVNKHDSMTYPLIGRDTRLIEYSDKEMQPRGFWLSKAKQGPSHICFGNEEWLDTDSVRIKGHHNLINILAAMSLGRAEGISKEAMVSAISKFKGLAHRCEWVGSYNGVDYINDSKATNVGAAISAIKGLADQDGKRIVLIAGGASKGSGFTDMLPVIQTYCKSVVVQGDTGNQMMSEWSEVRPIQTAKLPEAVLKASELAESGDIVLLAPACTSFDQFQNFESRGKAFAELVGGLS